MLLELQAKVAKLVRAAGKTVLCIGDGEQLWMNT